MSCPFCDLASDHVLEETEHSVAISDAFPLASGHSLIIPKQHVESLFELDSRELADVWSLVAVVRRRLSERFNPDGFTIGINDGVAAGQTVPHAHVHVIPRYLGDDADPRGGIRKVIPARAPYWEEGDDRSNT